MLALRGAWKLTDFDELNSLGKILRQNINVTARVSSPGMEALLFEPIRVLDHGFIRVVDYMGDDSSVVQAARVSYGKGTKQASEDIGLINYLMRHNHTTPFEMAEIKLHVKLPIFVARQWIRHRTASVNEYSARYSILENEFYVPSPTHISSQSSSNRQGRGQVLEGEEARFALDLIRTEAIRSYSGYSSLLNIDDNGDVIDSRRQGIARELARMNLSLGFYTQWYWKINLHNLMNFLRLRADLHAQYEIRAYANNILDIMKAWVPLTHEAFQEHRLGAVTFSASAIKVLRRMLAGEELSQSTSGLGQREWTELLSVIDARQ